jgi:hypothetical protein
MPIRDPKPSLDELPELIRAAYAEQALLPLKQVAELVGISPTTLSRLINRNKISSRHKGVGAIRKRHMFAIDDVAGLWHTMRSGPMVGPSTGARHGESHHPHRQAGSTPRR